MSHLSKIALICLCCFYLTGLNARENGSMRLDSLVHALDTAKTERSKVIIQYDIAIEKNITRPGFWDSIIHTAHRAGASDIEIGCLDRIGFYLVYQGDISSSIVYLKKAIAIATATGVGDNVFNPMYHITDAYFQQGDIKNAIDCGFRAIKNAEKCKNKKNEALGLSGLGKIYSRIGYPEKALQLHLKALKLSEENKLQADLIALLIYNVATDYTELKDTVNALKYYSRCGYYINGITASPLQAALYNATGIMHEMRGDPDSAEQYYQAANRVARQIDSKVSVVNTMVLLANNAYSKGLYAKAKDHATDALLLTMSIRNKIQIPKIAQILKNVYEKKKDYKEALRYNEMYLFYRDSLANETVQKQAMEREYQFALEQKDYKNRLLVNQNRIQQLILTQRNYVTTGLLIGIALTIVIFLMLVRQNKIKANQQKIRLEQKLLRTQMNPHFIFNALQAIQNMVLNNDKLQAVKYLSSFASLTREVLQNSKDEFINLSREISLVEHYLQLQKLRFGKRFDYSIVKEDHISDDVLVPPMLGQPFIENAVEHGMRNIESGGVINVSYTLTSGILSVKIIDNGHGMDIDQRNNKQHQSMAISITKERIQIMNKKKKVKTGFEIKDAFPGSTERKGVCVIFDLPVNLVA